MTIAKTDILRDFLLAVILYAVVVIYQGYQYGQSDQSQILPVLYAQDHPDAYANDHYVQSYLRSGINERTIFHALFRQMGYDKPWFVFFWHAISSLTLIFAWLGIARRFIKNTSIQWLAVALLFTIGFHTSTGSNELYYNQFIPSLPAKALASWGLYCWLKEKYTAWSLLLICATYLQPLVGLQVFMLTGIVLIIIQYGNKSLKTIPWKQMTAYILFAAPWIYLLAVNNGGQENPGAFMEIMEFRLSHHFFGSAFGFFHLLLGIFFGVVALVFYKERLRWICIIIITGCIVYEIGVEIFRSPFILYTQWWKTTIWLEAFAFIAIASFLEKKFFYHSKIFNSTWPVPIFFLLFISLYRFSGIKEKPLYMQPLSYAESDYVDISIKAQQLTPSNSVFIIPIDLSAFKWYSRRNTFVDYKALFHQEAFLYEWYDRIQMVYGYDLDLKRNGMSMASHSKAILERPTSERIQSWKSAGITHLVSTSPDLTTLQILGSNATYTVYKIP